MQEKFESIAKATDTFCDLHLNDEYKEMIRAALAALSRKRPSPLQRGRESTWAAAVVHAVGTTNFLFDRSQDPHCQAPVIYEHFGVAPSTGSNKSKDVRDLLKMHHFSPDWTLRSRAADHPIMWTLEVNGLLVDVRTMPYEVQEIAYRKGLIPYIPDDEE
ncbi:hypothetical protein G3446_08160 [Thiorhodococcus minor]|uniref:DUF6398 domain-containing protein n=2 Tax=Thiorhodococcus minor TaxID=57489 RepID=A0A6M0JYZ0_9GAMM|nr:DUF6398 domain-containing protein [Thiorhodococcus minor]NEV61863.1 hypothetical protein [Thiorhodococcus minor]